MIRTPQQAGQQIQYWSEVGLENTKRFIRDRAEYCASILDYWSLIATVSATVLSISIFFAPERKISIGWDLLTYAWMLLVAVLILSISLRLIALHQWRKIIDASFAFHNDMSEIQGSGSTKNEDLVREDREIVAITAIHDSRTSPEILTQEMQYLASSPSAKKFFTLASKDFRYPLKGEVYTKQLESQNIILTTLFLIAIICFALGSAISVFL